MIGRLCAGLNRSIEERNVLIIINLSSHLKRYGAGTLTKCLYQFDEPVSPHIAARQKTVSEPLYLYDFS